MRFLAIVQVGITSLYLVGLTGLAAADETTRKITTVVAAGALADGRS
jgi:hypothetical protein